MRAGQCARACDVCLRGVVLAWTAAQLATLYMLRNSRCLLYELMFSLVGVRFDWWLVGMAFSVALASCVVVAFTLAVFALARGKKGVRWPHYVVLLPALLFCISFSTVPFSFPLPFMYTSGLVVRWLALMAPLLHMAAAGALTCLVCIPAVAFARGNRYCALTLLVAAIAAYVVLPLWPIHRLAPCVGQSKLPSKPKIIAHRGGACFGPENSIVALEGAFASGVVMGVETDVCISTDGAHSLQRR
eukprot:TRINITY_DN4509_c0_g1_i2.p1 TRINITY_DN4509_c0_g1~~TRINITY_DN4509_c0_g1_i2.p1  ORF type:complete len:245 (-),score=56.53 TRINITY_DN4509_c0_g1_i2:932-1666(-)